MIALDYNSLLIAIAFCSAGLGLTFFISWIVARSDNVLLTWGVGASFIVISVVLYSAFVRDFVPVKGAVAFATLLMGVIIFWGGARQFNTGVVPLKQMGLISVVAISMTVAPMYFGYIGICYVVFNLVVAVLVFTTAWEFARSPADASLLALTIAGLYVLTGLSFLICVIPLVIEQKWVMDSAPTNWAESINLIVSLTAVASIGALSLGLNQTRVARRHERDAEVDPLTGLFNRRALATRNIGSGVPITVIVFDLDHFKEVNDIHGHQAGDVVLQAFSRILLDSVRDGDLVARLGGEEFAILLPEAPLKTALLIAERVRKKFAERYFRSAVGSFSSSVSAGISQIGQNAQLDALIVQADTALYAAKRSGRDRVVVYSEAPAANGPQRRIYNAVAGTLRRPSLLRRRV